MTGTMIFIGWYLASGLLIKSFYDRMLPEKDNVGLIFCWPIIVLSAIIFAIVEIVIFFIEVIKND